MSPLYVPLIAYAKRAGVTRQAILKRIHKGKLSAQKIGRAWFITKQEYAKARKRVKPAIDI